MSHCYRKPLTFMISSLLLGLTNTHAAADDFGRVASFPVAANLPVDAAADQETSAEIISASDDGLTLVYTDSPLGGIGFIDVSDATSPEPGGFLPLQGEPTSVVMAGRHALVGVNTSVSYVEPSGKLVMIDVASRAIVSECDLGGQPDSVALSHDGSLLAVAIENERDEDLNEGALPQLPAGYVSILPLLENAIDCSASRQVTLTGLEMEGADDPEPEFVDFNEQSELVVTLQENNHLVVIDASSGSILSDFSAGHVDLNGVDVEEEFAFDFTGQQVERAREPDAVKWLDSERFVTANEGDYKGGSRGFTIFDKHGAVLYDSGLDLEYRAIQAGHYPEKRSANKGIEPEGLEVATFDGERYLFVLAERAGLVGVYRDTGAAPEFVQLLPTGIAPEGAVAIPSRGLLVVANEADLIADGGPRSHVMLYERNETAASYPTLVSSLKDGKPMGWGALSGLAADPVMPGILYAVTDSFYAMQPQLLTIDATSQPARITDATTITRGGRAAQLLDLEGVSSDGEGGFWLASEGRSDRLIPHALYHINADGEIQQQIPFPAELLASEKRFASEGITLIDRTLWVAIQRSWSDDPDGTVKLLAYDLDEESWGAVRYPLDSTDRGWVGLSEITFHKDRVFIVERDNQIADNARIKRLYQVALSDLQPAQLGDDLPLVEKTLAHDFLPDLQASGGYVLDKVEGFAIDVAGQAFAVTDNDGVDDSSGESQFFAVDLSSQLSSVE
ncbi:esterase-like activity of phytase family protein [Granulosicoccus sp. 3-233]|uniref:esterase-like activity of phytase family protein n=1 Tax=Granulosicoccus sp. 3-233 TaxID=3417969 RepID=UPI003D32A34D